MTTAGEERIAEILPITGFGLSDREKKAADDAVHVVGTESGREKISFSDRVKLAMEAMIDKSPDSTE